MKQLLLSPQKLTSIAIAVACVFSLVSCTKTTTQTETQASASASPQPADPGVKHYQLTGRVVAIDKANKSLTVDGDDIPGFMSAMQMPYDVKDASLLDKLAVGDKIAADVVVKDDDSWLEKIRVTQPSTPATKPTSSLHIVKLSAA